MTTATWSHLTKISGPNISWTETLRLGLIVGSLGFVCLAGQLAQSRSNTTVVSATAHAPAAVAIKVHHRVTSEERYARSQINEISDLLNALTERAEDVIGTTTVSDSDAAQVKSALQALDQDLMAAQEALTREERAPAADARFAQEELRETLMQLSDSATRAQGELISVDQSTSQPSHAFKVSRIGQ